MTETKEVLTKHYKKAEKNKEIESKFNNIAKKLKESNLELPFKHLELIHESLDLNEQFVKAPRSSFLIKVSGDSMINAGIDNNDVLLVDKSKTPVHGCIVVAAINKKLTVKRLHYCYKETMLLAENDDYFPILVKSTDKLEIWGVATMVIKSI